MTEGKIRGDLAAPIIALLSRPRPRPVRVPGPLASAPVLQPQCPTPERVRRVSRPAKRTPPRTEPKPVAKTEPDVRTATKPVEPDARIEPDSDVEPDSNVEPVANVEPDSDIEPFANVEPVARHEPPAEEPDTYPIAVARSAILQVPAVDLRPRRRRRPVVLAAAAVAAVGLSAVAVTTLHGGGNRPTAARIASPTPAGSAPSAQAGTWALANLAHTDRLVSTGDLRATLTGHAFPAANLVPAATFSGSDQATDLIVDEGLRAAAANNPALAQAVQASQPLAVFGTGVRAVAVRQVLSLDGAQSQTVDAAARAAAGRALAHNARLIVPASIRQALTDGRLDLRAATTLAVLASTATITILDLPQDAAELHAGAQIRQVRLRTAVPDLPSFTAHQPAAYRLQTVARKSDGSYLLTWAPNLNTEPPVS